MDKDKKYKRFKINNIIYYFFPDNFEIIKLLENEKECDIVQEFLRKNRDFRHKNSIISVESIKAAYKTTISLNLISGCNLHCKYCYLTAHKLPIRKLSKSTFIDVLNFLADEKNHKIIFSFAGGGEPTLNFNLIQEIPEICKQYGFTNVLYELTTNGTTLTEEMIDFLKANDFKLYLSLDGDTDVTDSYRVYKDGHGIFKDVFNNIKLLWKKGVDFECKVLLQPNNMDILNQILFFENNKIKFKIDFAVDSFDNQYKTDITLLNDIGKQFKRVFCFYKRKILNNEIIYFDRLIFDIKRIHYGLKNDIACSASIHGYNIDIDGDIYSCPMGASSKQLSIGNIYNGLNYEKILDNQLYAKPVDEIETCQSCWVKYLCSGGCFALNISQNADRDKPHSYMCRIQQKYWSEIIKLYIEILPQIQGGRNIYFRNE